MEYESLIFQRIQGWTYPHVAHVPGLPQTIWLPEHLPVLPLKGPEMDGKKNSMAQINKTSMDRRRKEHKKKAAEQQRKLEAQQKQDALEEEKASRPASQPSSRQVSV